MRRSWKLWKSGRRRKAFAALDFYARELLLLPTRVRPDWALERMGRIEGTLPVAGSRLVAFVGCDPRYLEEHGLDLARSIARSSPDTALHLHLYHPGPHEHAQVASLRSELRIPVSATWDACRLDGHDALQRKTWYESARFVRLAQVLEQSSLPILAIDADCLVRAPLTQLLDVTGDADVSLVFRTERADSGLNVLASLVLVRPTAAARAWCHDVARRIARQLVTKPTRGLLDQRAMWFACRAHRRRVAFAAIPASASDATMAESSGVWHAKGERDGDARFQQERAATRTGRPL